MLDEDPMEKELTRDVDWIKQPLEVISLITVKDFRSKHWVKIAKLLDNHAICEGINDSTVWSPQIGTILDS